MSNELERWRKARPSPQEWKTLVELLDERDDDALVAEAETLLASWPDRLRAATPAGWESAQEGSPPSWWRLVRHLELAGLDQLRSDDAEEDEAPWGGALAHLTSLAIGTARDLWPLDALAAIPGLTTLDLSQLEQLRSFADLPVLPALRELIARSCPQLANLRGLDRQPALASLDLTRSPKLRLDTLPSMPGLRALRLDHTATVTSLAPLAAAPALEELYLSGCAKLTDIGGLAALPALRVLDLRGVRAADLSPLQTLGALRRLWLDGAAVAHLDRLAGLPLVDLYLSKAPAASLAPLGPMPALRRVNLTDIPGAADVDVLATLAPALDELVLARSPQAEQAAAGASLRGVKIVP